MHKINSYIYIETAFPGVTVGAIVTRQGIICVDTPTHLSDAQKWREKLEQLSPKPILYVINTDHHKDRIASNHFFNVPVIAHEQTGERLRLYPELFKSGGTDVGSGFELAKELAGVHIVPPQLVFSHEMTLLKGDREIVITHKPGAAPGAAWVIVPEAGVVFTGDTVVVGTHPFLADADVPLWLDSLAELRRAKFAARAIVPGRGKPVDKEGLKPLTNYLKLAQRKMDALIKNKRPRTDVAALAAELFKEFPVPDDQREAVARRIRVELEHMYDARHGETRA
jgi:glyoxylase-like metal-dependent hydrolase (beta-lactamase superfamily II)